MDSQGKAWRAGGGAGGAERGESTDQIADNSSREHLCPSSYRSILSSAC